MSLSCVLPLKLSLFQWSLFINWWSFGNRGPINLEENATIYGVTENLDMLTPLPKNSKILYIYRFKKIRGVLTNL